MAKAALKSSSLRKFSLEAAISHCFDVFPVRPLQKFQVQAKLSTIRPVCPDHLSISYDDVLTYKRQVLTLFQHLKLNWSYFIEVLLIKEPEATKRIVHNNKKITFFFFWKVICTYLSIGTCFYILHFSFWLQRDSWNLRIIVDNTVRRQPKLLDRCYWFSGIFCTFRNSILILWINFDLVRA